MKKALAFALAVISAIALFATAAPTAGALFSSSPRYELSFTNLTEGQPMTPPVFAVDDEALDLFGLYGFASPGVQQIAENGNLAPLADYLSKAGLEDSGIASGFGADGEGPVLPGETRTATFHADGLFGRQFSAVSMVVCTNDGFTGLDDIDLPVFKGQTVIVYAMAYDAGTETNTEDLGDLVPPCSGGASGTGASNPALAEGGRITPHEGITGAGDLDPEVWGFGNIVAKFELTRVS